MYFDDHDPPHFHVRGQNKAEIYIGSGRYKNGSLPIKKQRDVIVWLNRNKRAIMKAWNDCKDDNMPQKIPPL
ncbi:DUF4160 domain-containing protein [Lentibacillus halophilus]|uniref:DUF4160 domain-containing protein n=1 Tax=Lentibacillus halophilus TaxID=295065 RepID=A0ABP3IXU5_9BACI